MRVPATERRQQLIDAAIRLMRRDGVERTTLRAIATEAGAPLAAVHYCFEDKDELMHAAVEYWLHELINTIGEPIAVDAGLRATVMGLADRFWTSLEAEPRDVLAQLELVLFSIRQDNHGDLAAAIYPRYDEVLGQIFAEALDAAGEQSRIAPNELARALVGIIDAASLRYLADPASPAGRQLYYMLLEAALSAAGV